MKILSNEIDTLLDIIVDYPKVNIFHINDTSHILTQKLEDLANKKSYDYDLFHIFKPLLNSVKLDINQPRFNKHAKLYDYVFISSDLSKIEDKKLFFKKIYHICKNGSKILIFMENNDEELEQILEDLNFVASNYIDISNNYKVLSVQKMHGWGVYDMK